MMLEILIGLVCLFIGLIVGYHLENKNDRRREQLFNDLVLQLELTFVLADTVSEDGWYLWFSTTIDPLDVATLVELVDGKMYMSCPAISKEGYWIEPFGYLAGPILGK